MLNDSNKLKENPFREKIKQGLKKLNLRTYQVRWLKDYSRRRIALKSRQIGFSWLFALEGVVNALMTGKNQLFASASQDQSEIMIAYAKHFLEEIFHIEPNSSSAGKISLPNGTYLKALPKSWRTVQGFNGDIYFDEFAWNIDDDKMWKVLVPSTTSVQGRVSVASTPFAKKGKFYKLWTNKNKYSKHEIDIYKAIREGLSIKPFKSSEEFIEDLKDTLEDPDFLLTFFVLTDSCNVCDIPMPSNINTKP